MEWTDTVGSWFTSEDGRRALLDAAALGLAVVISALIAALLVRGAVRRVLRRHDDERTAAAVALLVEAARRSASWSSATPHERDAIARLTTDADVRLRLAPVRSAPNAAEWGVLAIEEVQRASVIGTSTPDAHAPVRDRLLAWLRSPKKVAKRIDLELPTMRTTAAEARPGRAADDSRFAPRAPIASAPAAPAETTAAPTAAAAVPVVVASAAPPAAPAAGAGTASADAAPAPTPPPSDPAVVAQQFPAPTASTASSAPEPDETDGIDDPVDAPAQELPAPIGASQHHHHGRTGIGPAAAADPPAPSGDQAQSGEQPETRRSVREAERRQSND